MSDWYYAADNEQKGPINEAELKEHLAGNKLAADTLVWKDGMDAWTPANQVPAFSFRQPPAPAKVQPGAAPAAAASTSSTTPVDVASLMGTPESLEVTTEDAEKNKVMGIIAYLGILCIVPLIAAKDSPFAKYHANQGLVLFLGEVALCIVINILAFIFGMIGLYFMGFVLSLVWLAPLVLVILGIINAAAGKCVPLPVIGGVKLIK